MSEIRSQIKLPEVVVYIAMSLDGFIATKDNGLSWLDIVKAESEDYGYSKFMGTIDAILMGRNTYDTIRGFGEWPYDGKKVFVFTHRPFTPIKDEMVVRGTLRDTLERLGSEGISRVYLDGGKLIQAGLREHVVDRIIVSIIPILLGEGISLFGSLGTQVNLKSLEAKNYPSGLVQLSYEVL